MILLIIYCKLIIYKWRRIEEWVIPKQQQTFLYPISNWDPHSCRETKIKKWLLLVIIFDVIICFKNHHLILEEVVERKIVLFRNFLFWILVGRRILDYLKVWPKDLWIKHPLKIKNQDWRGSIISCTKIWWWGTSLWIKIKVKSAMLRVLTRWGSLNRAL